MTGIIKVVGVGFLVVFAVTLSHADQYRVTRTSVIRVAETDALLTTATIRIWRLEVSSGFAGSSFRINGGTITQNKTSTQVFDTGSTQNKQYINQTFIGALLTAVGLSEDRLYWDFLFQPPRGEDSKGLQSQ